MCQVDASRNYDPSAKLAAITALLVWFNSADDFIKLPDLHFPQRAAQQMKNVRLRLVLETTDTHGHGPHVWAVNWRADLADLLARKKEAPNL